MKYIRPTHVALAMLAGSVAAGPAYACPPCGPMMAPVSAAPPSPSVRPPSINVPSVNPSINTNIRERKVLSPEQFEQKKEEMLNKARNLNEEGKLHKRGQPPSHFTDAELQAAVEIKLSKLYRQETAEEVEAKQALQRKAEEEEEAREKARRAAEWERQAKILKAAAEARAREKAEEERVAKAKRDEENKPITLEELARRNRVNKGEEAPGPGDTAAPWFQDTR
jgi:hypothetical protein